MSNYWCPDGNLYGFLLLGVIGVLNLNNALQLEAHCCREAGITGF
jgi:hypothetical protein